jgi:hypothetical protein
VAADKEMAARIEGIVADEEEKGRFPLPFHIKRKKQPISCDTIYFLPQSL